MPAYRTTENYLYLQVKKDLERDPSLLYNELYVFQHVPFFKLKFNQFPENIRSNPIFVLQYFSHVEATQKEYNEIPSHYFDNSIFMLSALEKNPDLYLLLSEKQKKPEYFKKIEEDRYKLILKYASPELLNDFAYCKEAVKKNGFNYQYASSEIQHDHDVCKELFRFANAAPFVQLLPKKILDDTTFITPLITTPQFFSYLPSTYKEDKKLCLKLIMKNSGFYEHISPLLKNDIQFIDKVICEYQHQFNYGNLSKFFHINEVLSHIPMELLNSDIIELHKKEILTDFSIFSEEKRKSFPFLLIVSDLLINQREITLRVDLKELIKAIPYPALRKSLTSYMKENKFNNQYLEVGKMIASYCLKQQLEKSLDHSPSLAKPKL